MQILGVVEWPAVVAAIAAAISAMAAIGTCLLTCILLLQLRYMKQSMKDANRAQQSLAAWNRLSATFTFFPDETYKQRRQKCAEALLRYGINYFVTESAIPDHLVQTIHDDPIAYEAISSYLNFLEDYASARRMRILDEDVAYYVMSDVIVRGYKILEPIIVYHRNIYKPPCDTLWLELQSTAVEWGAKVDKLRTETQEEKKKREAELVKKFAPPSTAPYLA